jgi:hypothetical protein
MQGLMTLVERGEFTLDEVADTLEGIQAEMDDKCRAVLHVREMLLGDIATIDAEIERLQALRKAPANSVDRLTESLKSTMLALNEDKMNLGTFKLTLRKPMKKLGEIDESRVPNGYFVDVPATRKLDKRALLADAKIKEIQGVSVVDGERSLMIK